MSRSIAISTIVLIIMIVFFAARSTSSYTPKPLQCSFYRSNIPNSVCQYIVRKQLSNTIQQIDRFFNTQYNWNTFSGVALISYKGHIIYEKAFGYSDRKKQIACNTNTAFQIGSMSKQFTAIAILQLVSQGKLSLDQEVSSIYSNFPYKGITIRMLLTHRSGLPNYIYLFENDYSIDRNKLLTNQEFVELLIKKNEKLYKRPGKFYQYSNTGYALLAAIVEKITGMSFEDYMKKNVFEPLDMKNTFFYSDLYNNKLDNHIQVAKGYLDYKTEAPFYYLNGVLGDKGIFTTVEDLHKWDTSLYKDYILPKNYIDSAFSKQSKTRLSNIFYGFGWKMYFLNDSIPVYFHSGWWQGYQSVIMRIPKDTITIVVLKNKKTEHPINQRAIIDILYPNNNFWNKNHSKKTVNSDES